MTENAIAKEIVDAAFRIHTTLGPGLLESVYHAVLAYELAQRGLQAVSQQAIPVVYGTIRIDIGFRADLISMITRSSDNRVGSKPDVNPNRPVDHRDWLLAHRAETTLSKFIGEHGVVNRFQ